jgi:Biotin and Thiamin Synthesis associated domain
VHGQGKNTCAHRRFATAPAQRRRLDDPRIAALGEEAIGRLANAIASFDDFCTANNPYNEKKPRVIEFVDALPPRSDVRLSAGRSAMTDEMQALCFFAWANSIFIGDTLLTAANPSEDKDQQLLQRLGMERTKAKTMTISSP